MKLLKVQCISTLVVTVVAMAVQAPVSQAAANPSNRAAIIASYQAEFGRVEPESQWTGDTESCNPGTTSTAYQMSVVQRVNWYREMAGLPKVALDSTNTAYAQAAALIGAANKALSHTPSTSVKCFTTDGYKGTSSSNIALGGNGIKSIDMYMADFGEHNKRAGHRAWVLSPRLGSVATGDIPGATKAGALYVFTKPITRVTPRDGAVAWPPSGYVPDAAVYDRWSYHRFGANFSNAQVSVTGPSGQLPVSVIDRGGAVDPGIVFEPAYLDPTATSDTSYTVTISGIEGTGATTVSYTTTLVRMNYVTATSKETTTQVDNGWTVKRRARLGLVALSNGISAPKTYATTGGCKISSAKKYLLAPTRLTTCTLSIKYRSSSQQIVIKKIKIGVI